MVKNIPGSRRKRRSKLLRQLNGSEIILILGKRVEGQYRAINEEKGILRYTELPAGSGGDRGYLFDGFSSKRIYIKKVEKVDTKNNLIKYLIQ